MKSREPLSEEYAKALARLDQAIADGDKERELWELEGLDEAGYFQPDDDVKELRQNTKRLHLVSGRKRSKDT